MKLDAAADAAVDRRVTLAAISEDLGVSLSTISKVLNGRADVSAATRERVEHELQERGYVRRGGGRSETRADLLELVFHELDEIWSMELIGGVEQVAKEQGLSVVLTVSGDRHAPDPDWVEGVIRRRPVGVVLVFSELAPEHRERLRARAIPFVIVDPAGDPTPEVPSVGSANWSGGLAATRHLIELGHRRIATITGPDDMMCSLARVDGYRSAMNSAGLPIDPAWIRFGDFHVTGGRNHARDLLALPAGERPTAIFAGSDLQALGVMDAARAAGLAIPGDLSIVGYDDVPISRWVTPPLTTVHQPLRRMGEEAARLAIRLAAEADADPTGTAGSPTGTTPRMDLATSLVVRESTAPPDPA
ncbi:LacI family DNA-binding transcriptional regulator [Agromyces sp. NPDC058110]|uniref:LacI family DNA-binding transcriptional regulator n=1 Tax=Agromyces sp. NPDC058110 TaxID=3346345 RepID=UPI0036DCFAF0